MGTKASSIGKNIICYEAGIGEIVEVTTLQEGGDEYYKVVFPKQNCINYFSMTNQKNYRVLSEKKTIDKAVSIFKASHDDVEYKTTQERISLQKSALKEGDICTLAKSLSIMNSEKDLHPQVSKSFKSTLQSFVDEIKFVTGLKLAEVYSLLEMKAPAKKAK